ncbi:hypothetical protein FIBSPDRAFT_1054664 [Athelia psychrophila]|uniref:Uncharacterized protein n=1 Tax=Athelia psychrophila TaxID=1759441 RepID=A0A167UZJ4_9AGAM|nr:hypothetical protein FIBSPDRAFT_1054664 [Fibularhizoctonia sp. CBS 109695]
MEGGEHGGKTGWKAEPSALSRGIRAVVDGDVGESPSGYRPQCREAEMRGKANKARRARQWRWAIVRRGATEREKWSRERAVAVVVVVEAVKKRKHIIPTHEGGVYFEETRAHKYFADTQLAAAPNLITDQLERFFGHILMAKNLQVRSKCPQATVPPWREKLQLFS